METIELEKGFKRNIKKAYNYITGEYCNCIQDNCPEYMPETLQDLIDEIYNGCMNNEYDDGYCAAGTKGRTTRFNGKEATMNYIKQLLKNDDDIKEMAEIKNWDLTILD